MYSYSNTHSQAHCILNFTDTHNPISLLSWIVQTYIPIPLLFPTLQKHTFTCPLPFCILQKHTFTYPLHIALHRNTHSHAATFNALKMNTLPCLLPSLYSTVAHIHRPIAVFHSTGTHILMPTALLHYIETAFTFPLPTAFHTEFTCPLYKALYRNIHSNAHYYHCTINKYSQPHRCPEFYKKTTLTFILHTVLYRNTYSSAHCSPAIYRNTHSYAHFIHSTVTYILTCPVPHCFL